MTSAIAPSVAQTGKPATGQNDALASLSSNFNNFLNLLMTQIQNQDPTQPMDTSQFTTELVQFTGVEQQINTNSNLTQLINLAQGNTLLQSAGLVGKQVTLQSSLLPLEGGSATVNYTAPAAEPLKITVSAAGTPVRTVSIQAAQGAGSWQWDGTNDQGGTLPDGPYTVAVTSGAAKSPVPFTTGGTVTGLIRQGSSLELQFGPASADLSAVQKIL